MFGQEQIVTKSGLSPKPK